jgi:putative transposase
MPRAKRDSSPGIHHVTVGATGDEPYYVDDVDRMTWTRRLVRTVDKYAWTCLLVCQMTTHVHLMVETPDESLPSGMHFLNFDYSEAFNERHRHRGCLQRARYWSKRARDEPHLLETFRYAARNPVRAGLCDRAEDWRWSSVATSCELAEAFPFVDASRVLGSFGAMPGARRRLLDFLAREG